MLDLRGTVWMFILLAAFGSGLLTHRKEVNLRTPSGEYERGDNG